MKKKVDESFQNFLIPMFNDVLMSGFGSIKDDVFKQPVIRTVELYFIYHIISLPNPSNTELGLYIDKLTDEYLS